MPKSMNISFIILPLGVASDIATKKQEFIRADRNLLSRPILAIRIHSKSNTESVELMPSLSLLLQQCRASVSFNNKYISFTFFYCYVIYFCKFTVVSQIGVNFTRIQLKKSFIKYVRRKIWIFDPVLICVRERTIEKGV